MYSQLYFKLENNLVDSKILKYNNSNSSDSELSDLESSESESSELD